MRHSMSAEMVQALEGMETPPDDVVEDGTQQSRTQMILTEEMLTDLVAARETTREEWHGLLAIEAAKIAKIFDKSDGNLPNNTAAFDQQSSPSRQCQMHGMHTTTAEDIKKIQIWKQQMTEDVHKQNPAMDSAHTANDDPQRKGDIEELLYLNTIGPSNASVQYTGDTEAIEQSLTAVNPAILRYDQFHAYDIITAHLDTTLAGESPPPLCMLIHGEPGTGKSKAIQMATEYFLHRGARFMLQKSPYTGIAASLIDGKTTHTIAMISTRKDHSVSVESKGKLQAHWRHIQYLVIDKVSMISKAFLAKLS